MDYEQIREQAVTLARQSSLCGAPVDIAQAAQYLGIEIRSFPMLASIPGFLMRGPHHPVIVVNASDSLVRRRFTVGHELWHFFRDEGHGRVSAHRVEFTDEAPWEERAANMFAAELLMPAEHLHDHVYAGETLGRLCDTFIVSRAAMIRRLRQFDLLVPEGAM